MQREPGYWVLESVLRNQHGKALRQVVFVLEDGTVQRMGNNTRFPLAHFERTHVFLTKLNLENGDSDDFLPPDER